MSAEHVIGEPGPLEGSHVEPSVGAITRNIAHRSPRRQLGRTSEKISVCHLFHSRATIRWKASGSLGSIGRATDGRVSEIPPNIRKP